MCIRWGTPPLIYIAVSTRKTYKATMEKYLSIVEEHTNAVKIDEVKLRQFLAQTNVWEYARITEQDYLRISPNDRFTLLEDYYAHMNRVAGQGIDSATANQIKNAETIKLTKQVAGPNQNFSTTLVAKSLKNENVSEIAAEPIWKKIGYFGQLRSNYILEKVNFPKNAYLYINQAYVTVPKSKKIFYDEYLLLGQIHESSNSPSDVKSYVCKEDKVKYFCPKYDKGTGKFLGLYETVSILVVQGDPSEVFLSYGYDTEKSKVSYLSFKHKIPSSFSGTLFNNHIKLID